MIAKVLFVACAARIAAGGDKAVSAASESLKKDAKEKAVKYVQDKALAFGKDVLRQEIAAGLNYVAAFLDDSGDQVDTFLAVALSTVAHFMKPAQGDTSTALHTLDTAWRRDGVKLDAIQNSIDVLAKETFTIYADIHLGAAFMTQVSGSFLDYTIRVEAVHADPSNYVDLKKFTMDTVEQLSGQADAYFSASNVADLFQSSLKHSPVAAALAYQRVVSARLQFFAMQHSALYMEHGNETELAKLDVDRLRMDVRMYNETASSLPVKIDYGQFDPTNPAVNTPGAVIVETDDKDKWCLASNIESDDTVFLVPYKQCQLLMLHPFRVVDEDDHPVYAVWEQLPDGRVKLAATDMCLNFEGGWCTNLIVWPCEYHARTVPDNMVFGVTNGVPWSKNCGEFPIPSTRASWLPVSLKQPATLNTADEPRADLPTSVLVMAAMVGTCIAATVVLLLRRSGHAMEKPLLG